MIGAIAFLAPQLHEVDDLADPCRDVAVPWILARDRERQPDVLLDREERDEVEELEHEAGPVATEAGCLLVVHEADGRTVQDHLAVARPVEPTEELEQRALAGSGRTHERHEFAFVDGE